MAPCRSSPGLAHVAGVEEIAALSPNLTIISVQSTANSFMAAILVNMDREDASFYRS
jgi:hypothetical protein